MENYRDAAYLWDMLDIHEYGEIKQERIWKVVKENIPQLVELLKPFI